MLKVKSEYLRRKKKKENNLSIYFEPPKKQPTQMHSGKTFAYFCLFETLYLLFSTDAYNTKLVFNLKRKKINTKKKLCTQRTRSIMFLFGLSLYMYDSMHCFDHSKSEARSLHNYTF